MSVDSYTLAAFLAGQLPERERRSVSAALVLDPEARELLHMACEALAAAFQSDEQRNEFMRRIRTGPSAARQDRPAEPAPHRKVA
jgi:hypothetical protein